MTRRTPFGKTPILSLYVTAGYPSFEKSQEILETLLAHPDVDMIELGMPFSDPLADGPVIQQSSQQALAGGMTMTRYFDLAGSLSNPRNIPILFMGYFNNVLQFGIEKFLEHCTDIGIASTIIPDLPVSEYNARYRVQFAEADLGINCLVSPQSSEDSIRAADAASHLFLYLVSSGSTTGGSLGFSAETTDYLNRIRAMTLTMPQLVGFGITTRGDFKAVSEITEGGIIGSAFLKHLSDSRFDLKEISTFIKKLRHDHSN